VSRSWGLPSQLTERLARAKPVALELEQQVAERLDEVLAAIVLAIAIVGSFWRLRWGVDFTDEAFYAAITQRYALGDWPYLDEYNLRQTASLLPVPFYWLYLKIMGAEGTVYFLRLLYFAVQCFVAWTVYRFALGRMLRSYALVAAAMPIIFVPFLIPTCSYNSLGAMFFAAGSFTGLWALLDDPRPRSFLQAGVLQGLACVSYPPMAVPVALFAVAVPFARAAHEVQQRQTKAAEASAGETSELATPLQSFLKIALGLVIVGGLLGLLLAPGLVKHGVSAALNYEHMTTRVRTMDKAKEVWSSALALIPYGSGSPVVAGGSGPLTITAVLALVAKQWPSARRWVLLGLVGYLGYYFNDKQVGYPQEVNSVYMTIYVGLAAGVFLVFVERIEGRAAMIWVGWLPSVVAGFITAFATANVGCVNGGVGLFAGAALTMIVAPMAADASRFSWIGRSITVLVLATVPLGTLQLNLALTYRAGPIASHTARVRSGPYKWIHSAPDKVQHAEDMTRAIREALPAGEPRMLAYYDFPAPYLSMPVRPAMPTVWTDSRARIPVLLPYYQQHRTGNGIVFVVAGATGTCRELEALVEQPSRLIKDYGWFRLYREPPP
jgi:hypothetical protein